MKKYADKGRMFNPLLVECPFCKWACDKMVRASFCPNCYAEYEVGKRGGILFDSAPNPPRFPSVNLVAAMVSKGVYPR